VNHFVFRIDFHCFGSFVFWSIFKFCLPCT
jgi:hypothetical protein